MTMLSFRVDDREANEAQQWAEALGIDRSELLREAAREYIRRRERWGAIFATGEALARQKGLKPDDVAAEIEAFRGAKRQRA